MLSAVAVIIGILVAGLAFYLYQTTKTLPSSQTKTVALRNTSASSPTPKPTIFLSVEVPKDEEVVDKRTVTLSGKTNHDAIVIISTQSDDQIITPSTNGSFSTTITIQEGPNLIEITAMAPNGEEATVKRTITFSAENF